MEWTERTLFKGACPLRTEHTITEQNDPNGDSNDDYSDWLFNTVHHWGESSMGLWTLKVRDSISGGMGTLNSWELGKTLAATRSM